MPSPAIQNNPNISFYYKIHDSNELRKSPVCQDLTLADGLKEVYENGFELVLCACLISPVRLESAPVNAPFSCPNRRLSTMFSGKAAQSTTMMKKFSPDFFDVLEKYDRFDKGNNAAHDPRPRIQGRKVSEGEVQLQKSEYGRGDRCEKIPVCCRYESEIACLLGFASGLIKFRTKTPPIAFSRFLKLLTSRPSREPFESVRQALSGCKASLKVP